MTSYPNSYNSDKLPDLSLSRKPNYVKIEAQYIDFFELFLRIENDCQYCFLLESLEKQSSRSRYDVIGFSPEALIQAEPNHLLWQTTQETNPSNDLRIPTTNPYQTLSHWIRKDIISRNYAGGLVGYLGYDASNFFEPILELKHHNQFPSFLFAVYTDGLIYDTLTGEMTYFYYNQNRLAMVKEWLRSKTIPTTTLKVKKVGASCTKAEHSNMVKQVMQEIHAGNTFQSQIGFQESYEIEGHPLLFYHRLRQVNPSPHMYYIKLNDHKLVGASPELIFRLQQGEMETFPLAGTTRRGKDTPEDIALARELLNDPKEIAEHNMLVDLHRNDLGRIARFATVKVRHLMDTKKFSHLQHISSEVTGIIDRHNDMFSGLAAVFPAGTLSGAPKIESMKIIERIEKSPRGPYGGAVGHFGFNGDCTFAIPIRTLFIYKQEAFARASGGIVYNSTPENEYLEIERKLAAIRQTLQDF